MKNKGKMEYYSLSKKERINRLKEIILVFLKLGLIAFGGPAAHVAMMEDELIKKRRWMSKEDFLDLYGATNLLPGPNSTELAIYLGYHRGGWRGLILSGVSFILPAMLSVMTFAAIYVHYEELPALKGIMYGIQPVIIAIVLQALIRQGKTAISNASSVILGVFVVVLSFLGVHELALLLFAGLVMMLYMNRRKLLKGRLMILIPILPILTIAGEGVSKNSMNFGSIFLTFLKIGSVLYGSGYVLLAFLEAEFIDRLGIITSQQLLDAVSVGQFTPGPVFTTATFIGYLLGGVPGGISATIGIFLPAFLLVGIIHPFIPKLRKSSWISGILDGVNVASLGLMAVVSFKLSREALVDLPTIIISLLALVAVFKLKINTAWLVLVGGILGLILA
ncbi:chromate efflux transporter [Alloiococcus sp. CFN-8]|uniref:chromate efflux transporter n=1 Tax=Alloiococcus sp. CFN-8 TaxID=3416081 RepID=UPI003CEACA84